MQKCRKTLQNCELRNVSKFSSDQFPLNTFQQLASVQSISFSQQCTAHDYNPDEKSKSFFRSQLNRKLFLLLQKSNVSKPVKPNVLAAREKVGFNPSEPSSHCGLCDFRQSVSWQLNLLPIYNLHLLHKTKQPAIYWENATCWQKNPQPIILGQDEVPSVQTAFTEVCISNRRAN